MEDQERSFDGEVIHQLPRFRTSWVRQSTSGAGTTHFRYVRVHPRPVKPQADTMQSACRVEMPAKGVAVEGNKDNVSEVLWDELKPGKRFRADDRFVKK